MHIIKMFAIFNRLIHISIHLNIWKRNPTRRQIEKARRKYYPKTDVRIGRIKAARLLTGWGIPQAKDYTEDLFK